VVRLKETCPKCGKLGVKWIQKKANRSYILFRHATDHYIGTADGKDKRGKKK